jgi:hypothetical protein
VTFDVGLVAFGIGSPLTHLVRDSFGTELGEVRLGRS